MKYGPLIGAVDQGTSSTRFLIFASKTSELLTYFQTETKQTYPKEGWVEQNPTEILDSVLLCIEKAVQNLIELEIDPADIKAIGVTNQRETTILWDKFTGKPLFNAIVWLDSRTQVTVENLIARTPGQNKEFFKPKCGLPLSTYFSAVKVRWLLDNVPEVATAVKEGRCLFGTVDSWLLWNLTGGVEGGVHVTDVSNAGRTMLMDLETQQWDTQLCRFFDIPKSILPEIRSSSEIYGYIHRGALQGVPISGCLGDQSAALVGQGCLSMGQAKSTYGTGCFLLYNTGVQPVFSEHGLLTTVAYKLGKDQQTHFALEGSVAISGACIQWLRDKLGIIQKSSEIESLALSVDNSHGTYFVPAFSGLYAPYWEPQARGLIIGLTQFTNKAHIARAALEAVCFQTREILEAMNKDSGIELQRLQVDGGMTENNLLMQLQADLLGISVVRPSMLETTALGAAMAAGLAEGVNVWALDQNQLPPIATDTFVSKISENERNTYYMKWKMAVQRSMYWETIADETVPQIAIDDKYWRLRALPGCLFAFSVFGLVVLAVQMSRR